jgi:hypothetical protein
LELGGEGVGLAASLVGISGVRVRVRVGESGLLENFGDVEGRWGWTALFLGGDLFDQVEMVSDDWVCRSEKPVQDPQLEEACLAVGCFVG